jgi:hypothetical protein
VSVPYTRTLPYVLREQLGVQHRPLELTVAEVVAVPDATSITVRIAGGDVTIARLASFTGANPGDTAYVLLSPLISVAIGSVK